MNGRLASMIDTRLEGFDEKPGVSNVSAEKSFVQSFNGSFDRSGIECTVLIGMMMVRGEVVTDGFN